MKEFYKTKRAISFFLFSFFFLSISFNSLGQEKGYVFQSSGVPANPNAQTEYIQPDGSSLIIKMQGDAVINWATTIDGYTLLINDNNGFEYAIKNEKDDILLSGILAKNPDNRSEVALSLLAETEAGISYSKSQIKVKKENHMFFSEKGKSAKGFPTTGTNNYLLILANFNNTTTTHSQTNFNSLMNTTSGTSSFYDYYFENSYGQLTLITTVTIWVTLPNARSYYAPQAKWGEFAYHSVQAADPFANYANFDNDGNGEVDGIGIIHQGRGKEESGNNLDIWSHSWDLTSAGYTVAQRTFDGTLANAYTTMPELANGSGTMTKIGVICHEFGHNLGAPDFYDTDYATNGQYDGTGNWDLMGGGTWNNNGATPAHHNAFTKWFYYGWVTPTTINTGLNVTLTNVEQNQVVYRYTTTTSNEYFLLENRQQIGFDTYIPGHGLIIYHVDENYIVSHFFANDINTSSHQGLYPKAAGGIINSTSCPFPGTTNNNSFTDTSTPNSKSWVGANTNKPITNIVENSQVVTFAFMGGATTPPATQFTVDNLYPVNWMSWANFTDQSTNSPTSWLWTITPATHSYMGTTSNTSQNPTVSFNQPGAYTVSLTATNAIGSNTLTKTDYIHVGQPGLWTGATSTNWNTNTNWENHEVAPATAGVSIIGSAINWPIKTGNLIVGTDCQSLNMGSGYTQLTITGDLTIPNGTSYYVDPGGNPDINVGGNWTNHGTFTPGNSVVKMDGNANSSLNANITNNGNQTTTYTGTHTYPGGYFDVMASGGKNISVNSFDIQCITTGTVNIEVWYTNGSYMGNTGIPGVWTQLGTTQAVTGAGWFNATIVNPGASLTIPSGASYGFYINCYSAGLGYLRLAAGPNTYSNSDITINTGDMAWSAPVGSGSWNGYTFNGTVYYSYTAQNTIPFYDLEINKTNASITTNGDLNINNNFTIKPDAYFTNAPNNTINVHGNTIFEADASGTASYIDNGVSNFINFQPNVESYLSQNRWHLVSAPINNALSAVFTGIYLQEFLEPTFTWSYITTTNHNLTAGLGFAAWSSSGTTGNATVNYNGPLNNSNIGVSGLSYTASQPLNNRGWNIVGNPYPSAINWNSNWTRTNIDATAYIYNNGNYVTWNGFAGTHPNGDIASGQGFFIKTNATGPALTIPQSERKHSTQTFYKDGKNQNELDLMVEGNGYIDKMIIQFNDEATAGFDNSFDAWKLKGDAAAPQLYSVYSNNELTVNRLPFEGNKMLIPINFEAGTNGLFTLEVDNLDNFAISSEIWLEDLRDDILIDLKQISSYEFNSNTSDENQRFLLHFGKPLGTEDEALSNLNIYSHENMVYVQKPNGFDGLIRIIDMLGQEIILLESFGQGLESIEVANGTAYYLVEMQSGNSLLTEKVFIKE